MGDLMDFAAGITLYRGPVRAETLAARYEQLLTDSTMKTPPPDTISPPGVIRGSHIAVAGLLGAGLIALGMLLWVAWDIRAGGIAAIVLGIAILGLAVRGWTINRSFRLDGTHVATALLDAADRAERQALAGAAAGDPASARAALELAADRLRALAPGSGRPGEVLERARRLRAAAATIRG